MNEQFHETNKRQISALEGFPLLGFISGSIRNNAMPSLRMRTGWLICTLFLFEAVGFTYALKRPPSHGVTRGFTVVEHWHGAHTLTAFLCSAAVARPFVTTSGQRLRVVLYARYSTDEQSPRSIEDQFAKCRQFVGAQGIHDFGEVLLSDAGISGERRDRPGINEVWRLIESGGCDLVVAEDGARLYRHATLAMGLLESAVDAGVRVIAINDHLDTALDNWRFNAFFSSFKSEISNRDTASRIIRAMDGLWRDGFAVGALRPGYIRIPSHPATEREPARGPFRDAKDERWTPVISNAFEMAARGDPLWSIAEYLDGQSFPKSSRSTMSKWTDETVRTLLRNTIYSGVETFRTSHNVKKYRTGRSVQIPTSPEKILHREMPHLAHVPKWLQAQAITAMEKRARDRNANGPRGKALTGIPRDSRGPLSQHFFCGICNAKMYCETTRYTCADSRRRPTRNRQSNVPCWNRCKPLPAIVHEKLSRAILGEILHSQSCIEAILECLPNFLQETDRVRSKQVRELQTNEADVLRRCDRLRTEIEEGRGSTTLSDGLRQRESELQTIRFDLERLMAESSSAMVLPTKHEVFQVFKEQFPNALNSMDRASGPVLRRLISPIQAFPYQQFDAGNVGLRAYFTLHLLELLPEQWRNLLAKGQHCESLSVDLKCLEVPMVVNLFDVPQRIQYAKRAGELRGEGRSIAQIAAMLEISERVVERALETYRRMSAQHIDDPYIRMTEPPKLLGRWKPQGNHRRGESSATEILEIAPA